MASTVIAFRPVQLRNILIPILVTPLGIVTLVRPVHPKNATSPTLVTLLSVHAEYEPDPTARSVVIVTVPDPVGGTAAVLAAVTYPSMYCVVGLAVTAARSLCPTANPIDGVDVYEKIFMPPPIPIELLLVELVTPPPIPPPPIPIELLLVDSPCTPGAPEIVTLVRPVQL